MAGTFCVCQGLQQMFTLLCGNQWPKESLGFGEGPLVCEWSRAQLSVPGSVTMKGRQPTGAPHSTWCLILCPHNSVVCISYQSGMA